MTKKYADFSDEEAKATQVMRMYPTTTANGCVVNGKRYRHGCVHCRSAIDWDKSSEEGLFCPTCEKIVVTAAVLDEPFKKARKK